MLVGKELLDKARSLSNRPEDEIARGCGYVGPSGRVLRKSFYKALVEAKGYKLRTTNRPGSRSSRGRQAEFRTRVHGNGNLLIGHAYTKKLISAVPRIGSMSGRTEPEKFPSIVE